jgi:hypothetical protein
LCCLFISSPFVAPQLTSSPLFLRHSSCRRLQPSGPPCLPSSRSCSLRSRCL